MWRWIAMYLWCWFVLYRIMFCSHSDLCCVHTKSNQNTRVSIWRPLLHSYIRIGALRLLYIIHNIPAIKKKERTCFQICFSCFLWYLKIFSTANSMRFSTLLSTFFFYFDSTYIFTHKRTPYIYLFFSLTLSLIVTNMLAHRIPHKAYRHIILQQRTS